jgi:hypothetical protein
VPLREEGRQFRGYAVPDIHIIRPIAGFRGLLMKKKREIREQVL